MRVSRSVKPCIDRETSSRDPWQDMLFCFINGIFVIVTSPKGLL